MPPKLSSHHKKIDTHNPEVLSDFIQLSMGTKIRPTVTIAGEEFNAIVNQINLCSVRLFKIKCSPLEVNSQMIKEHGSEQGAAHVHVHLQLSGTTEVSQGEDTYTLSAGDWGIHSSNLPYKVNNLTNSEKILIIFSLYDIYPDAPNIKPLTIRINSSKKGASKLFFEFIKTLFYEHEEISASSKYVLTGAVLQLFKAAVLDDTQDQKSISTSQIIYDQIRNFVAKNLADPNLNIDSIAEDINCSKRYLHMVFRDQAQGDTIANYILRRRLTQCHQELSLVEHSHKSVSKIAYSWGFSDPSYFSRAFKKVYGVTPKSLRANL